MLKGIIYVTNKYIQGKLLREKDCVPRQSADLHRTQQKLDMFSSIVLINVSNKCIVYSATPTIEHNLDIAMQNGECNW